MESEEGVGNQLHLSRQPIRRPPPSGGLDHPREISEKGEKRNGRVSSASVGTPGITGVRLHPQLTAVAQHSAGPSVGISHPKERVTLPLREHLGRIAVGSVVRGSAQQGPPRAIPPEPRLKFRERNPRLPYAKGLRLISQDGGAATAAGVGPTGDGHPLHDLGNHRGPRPALRAQPHRHPGEPAAAPVRRALREYLSYELDVCPGLQRDVQEPGPGDVYPSDSGLSHQPMP